MTGARHLDASTRNSTDEAIAEPAGETHRARLGGRTTNREKVRVLASIAECRQEILDHEVLLNVAILWAHHLKVGKDEIERRSMIPRSTFYPELPRTQEFIEKLRTDAQLEQTDRGVVLACNLCNGEFTTELSERTRTYPAIRRHWRESHGWFLTARGTPKASDEYLAELGSSPILSRWLEARQSVAARSEVEAVRTEYAQAFEGEGGEQLEKALAEIVKSDDDQHDKAFSHIRRSEQQEAASAAISEHANKLSMLRYTRHLAIAKAQRLKVSTKTIAEIVGVTVKTVRTWQSEDQSFSSVDQMLGELFDRPGLRPEPPPAGEDQEAISQPDYEVVVKRDPYCWVIYRPDGEVVVRCTACDLEISEDSDQEASGDSVSRQFGEYMVRRHWQAIHAQPLRRFNKRKQLGARRQDDPVEWIIDAVKEDEATDERERADKGRATEQS